MDEESEKGFVVDIPEDAINDAVQSVEKRLNKKAVKSDSELDENADGEVIEVEIETDNRPIDASETGSAGPSRDELVDALQKAREEAKAARDRMLRALADADNQRKRLRKERDDIILYGQEGLIRDFLPALDNLDRTVAHLPQDSKDPSVKSLIDGLAMVQRQFEEILGKHNLQGFVSVGENFDPNRHEALNQVETSEHVPGTVISEMHRGYLLHNRLLRAALVSVAVAPNDNDEEDPVNSDKCPDGGSDQ